MCRHEDVVCLRIVSCVHPVAALNAAFCMTCRLLMLVEDARGEHIVCLGISILAMFLMPHRLGIVF